MQKGDFVLVRFPFTDLTSAKLRPALILSVSAQRNDAILAFVTTQTHQRDHHDILLDSTSQEFPQSGLKKPSLLKLQKLVTLNTRVFLGRIGVLPTTLLPVVNTTLKRIFEL